MLQYDIIDYAESDVGYAVISKDITLYFLLTYDADISIILMLFIYYIYLLIQYYTEEEYIKMKTKLRIIMILLTFISKNTFSKKLVTSPRKLDAGIKDRF